MEVSPVCVVGVLEVLLSREMEDGAESSGIGIEVRFDGLRGIRGSGFVLLGSMGISMTRDWRERRFLSAIGAGGCEYAIAGVNMDGPDSPLSGWSDEGGRTLMAGSADELILSRTKGFCRDKDAELS